MQTDGPELRPSQGHEATSSSSPPAEPAVSSGSVDTAPFEPPPNLRAAAAAMQRRLDQLRSSLRPSSSSGAPAVLSPSAPAGSCSRADCWQPLEESPTSRLRLPRLPVSEAPIWSPPPLRSASQQGGLRAASAVVTQAPRATPLSHSIGEEEMACRPSHSSQQSTAAWRLELLQREPSPPAGPPPPSTSRMSLLFPAAAPAAAAPRVPSPPRPLVRAWDTHSSQMAQPACGSGSGSSHVGALGGGNCTSGGLGRGGSPDILEAWRASRYRRSVGGLCTGAGHAMCASALPHMNERCNCSLGMVRVWGWQHAVLYPQASSEHLLRPLGVQVPLLAGRGRLACQGAAAGCCQCSACCTCLCLRGPSTAAAGAGGL